MSVHELLEFMSRFFQRARPIWKVLADLRIPVERVQGGQVTRFKMARQQKRRFEEARGVRPASVQVE
jgi:hypothetical protein